MLLLWIFLALLAGVVIGVAWVNWAIAQAIGSKLW